MHRAIKAVIMTHLPIVSIVIAFLMIVPQSNGAEKL